MSERLGVVTLGGQSAAVNDGTDSRSHSEHAAGLIDREIRRLVDEAYARAQPVIVEQRGVLDRIAGALLRWETLQGAELERAFVGEVAYAEPAQASTNRIGRTRSPSMAPRLLPGAAMSITSDLPDTLRSP